MAEKQKPLKGTRITAGSIIAVLAASALVLAIAPMAASEESDGRIAWTGHGSEHIEGCETGFHWIFSPGGGVTDVVFHSSEGSTPMVQMGESGEGAWHHDSGLIVLEEGIQPNVTFNGTPHAQAALRISNCLDEDREPDRVCPPLNLSGIAHGDTSITVMWDHPEGVDEVGLYRDGVFIGAFNNTTTSYHDTDTELHVTYTYAVTVFWGEEESEICEEIEVTAIPVFPSLIAGAIAVAASALGYLGMTRRKV